MNKVFTLENKFKLLYLKIDRILIQIPIIMLITDQIPGMIISKLLKLNFKLKKTFRRIKRTLTDEHYSLDNFLFKTFKNIQKRINLLSFNVIHP